MSPARRRLEELVPGFSARLDELHQVMIPLTGEARELAIKALFSVTIASADSAGWDVCGFLESAKTWWARSKFRVSKVNAAGGVS